MNENLIFGALYMSDFSEPNSGLVDRVLSIDNVTHVITSYTSVLFTLGGDVPKSGNRGPRGDLEASNWGRRKVGR
jgi:hypothetical protein